jgi:hypothetical protein
VLEAFGQVADILQAFTHDARSSWTLSDAYWIRGKESFGLRLYGLRQKAVAPRSAEWLCEDRQ